MKKQFYVIFGIVAIIGIILVAISIQKSDKVPIQKSDKIPTTPEITEAQLTSLGETQCKQGGYNWVNVPGLCASNEQGQYDCGYRCDINTADAGKKCYSSDECEGVCLCNKNEKDSEGFRVGECSQYKYFTEVIDCPCILETKSKTPNYPYGCE